MEYERENKIPVINYLKENLKPGSESWVLASKQVRYGLEEFGCVEIVYDKFPLQLHNLIFCAAKDLFDLPKETKMQKTSDTPGSLGYVAPRPTLPLYENIGIDTPTTIQNVEHFTDIMWPAGNDSFCEIVHSFSKWLVELYATIKRMVFEEYGLEGLSDSFMDSTFHLFRFFKYRAPQRNETNVGLGAHTDSTFISILHQHQVKGLQIKTKDGQWIDVNPSSSSFLVLAGDILMAWSNDRIRACEHHVIMKENKDRYSVGLFAFIKGVIRVPEELVDDEHPLQYKPIDNFAYRHFYISEESRKCACRIKAFCGI